MSNRRIYNPNRTISPSGQKERVEMVYIRGIPADIKYEFKTYCAARGWSMTDAIIKAMRAVVRQDLLTQQRPRKPRNTA